MPVDYLAEYGNQGNNAAARIGSGLGGIFDEAVKGWDAGKADRKKDLTSKADILGKQIAIYNANGDKAGAGQAAEQLHPILEELHGVKFGNPRNQLPVSPAYDNGDGSINPQRAMAAPQNNSGGNVGSDFLQANSTPLGQHYASGTMGPYRDTSNRTTGVDPNPMTPMNYGRNLFTPPPPQGGQLAQSGGIQPAGMMSTPPQNSYAPPAPGQASTSAYDDQMVGMMGRLGHAPEKPWEIPMGGSAMDPLTGKITEGARRQVAPKAPPRPQIFGDAATGFYTLGPDNKPVKLVDGKPVNSAAGGFSLGPGEDRYDGAGNVIASRAAKESDPLATETRLQALVDRKRKALEQTYTKVVGGMKMGVDEAAVKRDLDVYEKGLRTKLDPTYDTSANAVPPDMRGAFTTFRTSLHKNEGGGASMNTDTYNEGKGTTWAFGKSQFNLATNPGAWKPLVDSGVITDGELRALQNGSASQSMIASVQSRLAKAAPLIESLDNRQAAMLWNNATRWIDKNKYQASDPSVVAQIADIKNQFGPAYNPQGIARNGVITPDSVKAWRQRVPHAGAMNRFSNIQSAFSAAPKQAAAPATSLANKYADKYLGAEVGDN